MKSKHPYFSRILKHIIIWVIAFLIFNILRGTTEQIDKDGISHALSFVANVRFHLMIGVLAGIIFGTYSYLLNRFLSRNLSFGRNVTISSLGYFILILLLIFAVFNVRKTFFDTSLGRDELEQFLEEGRHFSIILYCFMVGFLIEFLQEIDRKFGPGNLWRMLKGTYYHPIEEERVLMFLDMRSSTTIAEKLGHIKYSRLVQDCFKDISVIAEYGGHIYQYVGDEAVLTWKGETGFAGNNCVNAFFAYRDQLESRREYFLHNYGLVPEFKAGINVGMITAAEVGDIKREIAFHGDTINTAARIQSMCNELDQDFLASEAVIERLEERAMLKIDSVGEIQLKGKNTKVIIHAISRIIS